MCTSIATVGEKFYFGRNLDLEYSFGDGVVIMPRNFPLRLRCGELLRRHFAIIGMAKIELGYPLFAEGMNEFGVCIAGLNFAGNARYAHHTENGKTGIAPFELIPYLLSTCQRLDEIKDTLERIRVVDVPFSEDIGNSPLHWHIADKNGSITLEITSDGMKVYDNPHGVLTNNPTFPFHRDNLSLYLNLENVATKENLPFEAEIYGGGLMAHGLPGDYSSPSRFVKAAWLMRHHSKGTDTEAEELFSILSAVAPPKGAVINSDGQEHFTRYSCIMSGEDGVYYYRTFDNSRLRAVKMKKESLDDEALLLFRDAEASDVKLLSQPKIL
ncbi:MAG: choloylglycine hydrolase family protein [Clostridia bacterium]|nr:choloylglycine hydrolase family protein [Clostridia bacterium]